jgi:nucleoside-diphosphate-sugar epimerase
MMLVGATGFVGSNFLRLFPNTTPVPRERLYLETSKEHVDTLVVAAPSAEKWRANLEPEEDRAQVETLASAINSRFSTERIILFSSIDVYGPNSFVTEEAAPSPHDAYGENRAELARLLSLEHYVREIRLPGLFGPGLKKNLLFDIKHERLDQIAKVNRSSSYQFVEIEWAMRRLFEPDMRKEKVVNLVTEPFTVEELQAIAPFRLPFSEEQPIVTYGVKTSLVKSGYFAAKDEILNSIGHWLRSTTL